jgi:hypothetical protein
LLLLLAHLPSTDETVNLFSIAMPSHGEDD